MTEVVGTGAHLTPTELRVWTSLLDASRILESELERSLVSRGMTHREYEVLVRVDGADGRLRMSLLARQIEESAALVSQTVARLETRGWVTREAAEHDARGVDAVLTKVGRAALAAAAEPHAQLIRTLLLDPIADKLADTAEALGVVADHLRAHRTGSMCPDANCPMNG